MYTVSHCYKFLAELMETPNSTQVQLRFNLDFYRVHFHYPIPSQTLLPPPLTPNPDAFLSPSPRIGVTSVGWNLVPQQHAVRSCRLPVPVGVDGCVCKADGMNDSIIVCCHGLAGGSIYSISMASCMVAQQEHHNQVHKSSVKLGQVP